MKALKLLVSGTLLAWLAWRTDWRQVGCCFGQLRIELWLAALGLYCLLQVVSGLRWRFLSRPLGFERPVGHFVGFYYIGMFFNLALPTSVGGDVVRAWYLNAGSGRRLAALVSVLVDRASGLIVLLALACGAVLLCPLVLPDWIRWSVWLPAAAAGTGLVLALLLGKYLMSLRLFRLPLVFIKHPGVLAGTTLLSLVVQVGNVAIVWLVGWAIDAPVPGFTYWIVVPMVSLLTLLPSINGMGIREGGMVLYLTELGIPASTALSMAFLWFAVSLSGSLLGGLVYLFSGFPRVESQESRVESQEQEVESRGGNSGSPLSTLDPRPLTEVSTDDEPVRGGPDQGRTGQYPAAA